MDDLTAEVARLKKDYASLIHQLEMRGGRDGHIYDGPDCVLCGHFGPADEDEPCDAEKRFAQLKALMLTYKERADAYAAEIVRLQYLGATALNAMRRLPANRQAEEALRVLELAGKLEDA